MKNAQNITAHPHNHNVLYHVLHIFSNIWLLFLIGQSCDTVENITDHLAELKVLDERPDVTHQAIMKRILNISVDLFRLAKYHGYGSVQ